MTSARENAPRGATKAKKPTFPLPLSEFEFSYSRSSGPGGQNVNKVNSRATVRWNIVLSPAVNEGMKRRFLEKYSARLTKEGELIVSSDRFRDQKRNVEDCLQKIESLLLSVKIPPKKRRATKPSKSSQERRLQSKGKHSVKKDSRQKRHLSED